MILIDLAKTIMPQGDFVCASAHELDVHKQYDVVLSHSVFHYFESLSYAKSVVMAMVKKAKTKIAIFDINDASKQEQYVEMRAKELGKEEYEAKYKGLEHLFYEKSWFENLAKELGLSIEIFDQTFKQYANSKLRFNVIMEKV